MEMLKNHEVIETLLNRFGGVGLVLILLLIVFVSKTSPHLLSILCERITKPIFRTLLRRNTSTKIARTLFLAKLDYWLDYKLRVLDLGDPARTLIFRDILNFKLQNLRKEILAIDFDSTSNLSGVELYALLSNALTNVTANCETDSLAAGVPEIALNKFLQWQTPTYQVAIVTIGAMCESQVYTSSEMRLEGIFSVFLAHTEFTVINAESALKTLNGELSGVEYKGYICS